MPGHGFILQTGLAPGFINVLAMSLYQKFVEKYENEKIEKIGMKVGACPLMPTNRIFTVLPGHRLGWPLNMSKTRASFAITKSRNARPLSARETIVIGARTYEADLTSGGAADLPDFFAGRAKASGL